MKIPFLLVPPNAVAVIVSAFRHDPAVRWMYPADAAYDRWFPRFVEAFAGAAFAHDTVLAVEGGSPSGCRRGLARMKRRWGL